MAFESVQIVSTRNGVSSTTGYREDLAQADVVGLALSSMVGVTSVLWRLLGRPELSAAGGAGPEPVVLATAPTSAFTVDSDSGSVHKDGTYLVEATINPGSPGQVRKTAALARLSGLTIPGPSGPRVLRKPGGFESLEDTSVPTCRQGYSTPENRWHEFVRQLSVSGPVGGTLAGAYLAGASAGDQTLSLSDADGGGLIVDGSGGGFTGASALRINTAVAGPMVVDRATGNVGVGIAAPLEELHVRSTSPGLRLDRSGGAAISLENITDVLNLINRTGPVTIATFPGSGGMRTDFGVGIGAAVPGGAGFAMGLGISSGIGVSTANTGRFRYNESTQQFEVSQNGGAYAPLGAGAASVLETDGIATGAVQLSSQAFPATGAIYAHVKTVRDLFYLDRTSTLTADGITTVTALGGIGRWIRMCLVDSTWYAQLSWGLDPAGTFGTPGNDEATGDFTHPLRSMAEWRRRNRGAVWATTAPVIRLLSTSTVLDDGIIEGVSTPNLLTFLTILATPTVLFSGTVSSYQAYSGNTRGSFVDTALASTWTAAGGISSPTGGRFVRRQGTGVRPQGPLIKDMGSKTVMFGILANWDETATGFAGLPAEVDLANGDIYEVVSVPGFPFIQPKGNINIRVQNIEVLTRQLPGVSVATLTTSGVLTHILCSFGRGVSASGLDGNGLRVYSSVFTPTSPEGLGTGGNIILGHCAFAANTILELSYFNGTTTGTKNVHVGSEFRWWHGNAVGSLGEWRCFDMTTPLLNVRHDSTLNISGPIVGSGNSGALVNVDTAGIVYGAENISATTSLGNAYTVSGVGYTAPKADARTGDAIYNRSTGGQFLVPDAVDSQAAVPLHQVNSLITTGAPTFTTGSVIFAGGTGALAQDNARFFWDATNHRLGIGTAAPSTDLDIVTTATGVGARVRIINSNAASAIITADMGTTNGTHALHLVTMGVNSLAWDATVPNLTAGMVSLHAISTTGMYIGSPNTISMQTGATQAERLKILTTGQVQLSSLVAGGMVKSTAGQLGIAVSGTDFLAPPGGGLTTGSVLFAGLAGAVAQDNANFFWDDTLDRLGIGTNVPAQQVDVVNASASVSIRANSTLSTGISQFLAANSGSSVNAVGFGFTGSAHVGSGATPNLGALIAYASTGTTMYIGASAAITLQTGSTHAERLRILTTGEVQLSSLGVGGMVKAAVTTGQLSIGVAGTDYLAPSGALTVGSVLFAGAGNTVAQDNANFFFDDTNNRLGIGTNAPLNDLNVVRSSSGAVAIAITNPGTGTATTAFYNAQSGAFGGPTATMSMGMTGTAYSPGGGSVPNLGSNTAVITTVTPGPGPVLYLGSHGVMTLQTGATQAERVRILSTGEVQISSLSAGGVVVADPITGKLGIGSSGGGGSGLGVVNTGGAAAFSLATLPSGVLEHVVTLGVSAPTSIAMVGGQIPFGNASGSGLLSQDANLFWDVTNHRLGIGTQIPAVDIEIDRSTNGAMGIRLVNQNTGALSDAVFNVSNLTATAAFGITGTNWVEAGGSTIPNRVANEMFLVTALPGPAPAIYIGSHGFITLQTGATQAERVRILQTGEVQLSSLTASGVVQAAVTTGQLGVFTVAAGRVPFGAPLGGGLAQDVLFFWNDTLNRLGVGTSAPQIEVDISNTRDAIVGTSAINISTGINAKSAALFSNGSLTFSVGIAGTNWATGTGTPNLAATQAFIIHHDRIYFGSDVDGFTFQTGSPTQIERFGIRNNGDVQVFNLLLAGDGVIKATSGVLARAIAGTDFVLPTGVSGGQTIIGGTGIAENLTFQSTANASRGNIMFNDPVGIGRSPGTLGFAPQFAIAGNTKVTSATSATLDYVVVNTSTVTVQGVTNITTATGFNWVTLNPPAISTVVTIGNGVQPAAATLAITGVPTISGGGSFAGGVGGVGLWVQSPTPGTVSAQFDGGVRIGEPGSSVLTYLRMQGTNTAIVISEATGDVINLGAAGGQGIAKTSSGDFSIFNETSGNLSLGAGNVESFRILGTGSAGQLQLASPVLAANGSVATALGSLGPAGSHTAPQEWMTVKNASGVQRWIPMF